MWNPRALACPCSGPVELLQAGVFPSSPAQAAVAHWSPALLSTRKVSPLRSCSGSVGDADMTGTAESALFCSLRSIQLQASFGPCSLERGVPQVSPCLPGAVRPVVPAWPWCLGTCNSVVFKSSVPVSGVLCDIVGEELTSLPAAKSPGASHASRTGCACCHATPIALSVITQQMSCSAVERNNAQPAAAADVSMHTTSACMHMIASICMQAEQSNTASCIGG